MKTKGRVSARIQRSGQQHGIKSSVKEGCQTSLSYF
jgi:hypothetical protein